MKNGPDVGVRSLILASAFAVACLLPAPVSAHCDGMDGPVVKAAQQALASNDVNRVLIWVRRDDEAEIRRAFDQTMAVRRAGPQAADLADRYFFETLVRIHRAGEGAPYTGLKPAGRDLGPAIPAADQALTSGDVEPLASLLVEELRAGLRSRHARAKAASSFDAANLDGGREYVAAYVDFLHYAERVHESVARAAAEHDTHGATAPHDEK